MPRTGPADFAVERWEREDTWQSLAIASALILFVGFIAASIWVIVAPSDVARLQRVQISAPFGVFGGAVVTFCTIVWRGLISKRQADSQLEATNLQREQIDRLASQITATEETNLAALLQKGAELIAEATKEAYVAAGIATLQSVATDKNAKFAVEAMNLLADFINNRLTPGTADPLMSSALAALAAGADLGRIANRNLHFKEPDSDEGRSLDDWLIVRGVNRVSYSGGNATIYKEIFDRKKFPKFHFNKVKFMFGAADFLLANYNRCEFSDVDIIAIRNYDLRINVFSRCDFSSASFKGDDAFRDVRDGQNYFDPDSPPQFDIDFDPSMILHSGRPFEENEIPF